MEINCWYLQPVSTPSLKAQRDELIRDTTVVGLAFTTKLSAIADAWIADVANAAPGANPKKMALIATGGYGRGQLAPFSDLDLLLVHTTRRGIEKFADQLWYPIWDQGVGLDHAVRTPKEVAVAAADDLRVSLGLLDGRCIDSQELAEQLLRWLSESDAKEFYYANGYDEIYSVIHGEIEENE